MTLPAQAVALRALPKAEQHRFVSRFTRLSPDELRELCPQEAGWLFAWIFEQQGLSTERIQPGSEWVDLDLVPQGGGKAEFARIYTGKRGTPLNAVYATLKALEGRSLIKVHLYTMGKFPPALKRVSDQFPIAVEQQAYDDLVCRLLEAQASYRVDLHQRRDFYPLPKGMAGPSKPAKKQKKPGWWARFNHWIDHLFNPKPSQEKKDGQKTSRPPDRKPGQAKPVLGTRIMDDRPAAGIGRKRV